MKHIGNNTEEAALKRSNVGYVLVLIAALMWGTIGIFVNGISALGVSSQSMAALRLLSGAVLWLRSWYSWAAREVLVREKPRSHGAVQCKS